MSEVLPTGISARSVRKSRFRKPLRVVADVRGLTRHAPRQSLLTSAATLSQWMGFASCIAVLSLRRYVEPWVLMWLLAGTIFVGFKWLTWSRECVRSGFPSARRSLGYLFAWPGMDARSFLNDTISLEKPRLGDWLPPLAKIGAGALLLWVVARHAGGPLAQAWVGMLGLICALHFGIFELLALSWQSFGVPARVLMDKPLRATSLAELWGRRWNVAFSQLAREFVFRPVARPLGPTAATAAVFLFSGIIHDLVISVPAGAGHGLPTAYFAVQGAGVLFERSAIGRALALGRGARGWLFTVLITAAPAFWLFHPPFAERVMVPFLKAICAL